MPLRGPAAMLGQPTLGIVVDSRLNYEFKWGMGAWLSLDIVFVKAQAKDGHFFGQKYKQNSSFCD